MSHGEVFFGGCACVVREMSSEGRMGFRLFQKLKELRKKSNMFGKKIRLGSWKRKKLGFFVILLALTWRRVRWSY